GDVDVDLVRRDPAGVADTTGAEQDPAAGADRTFLAQGAQLRAEQKHFRMRFANTLRHVQEIQNILAKRLEHRVSFHELRAGSVSGGSCASVAYASGSSGVSTNVRR